jgi:hypothetical protein
MMRFVLYAAVAAAFLTAPVQAQTMSRDGAFIYCHEVTAAVHLHQMASGGSDVFLPAADEAMDNGRCDAYQGASKWKIVNINKTAGYAKIVYDIHTKKQKVGFIPYFYVWGMGMDQ